jgi:uncharacterized membrane protein
MRTVLEKQARMSGGDGAVGAALTPAVRPRPVTARRYQQMADSDRGTGGEKLADFLGFFSVGLGLTQIVAPQLLARVIGIRHPDEETRSTMRLCGLRELSSGIAILSNPQPRKAVWSRVVGDALDLLLLGRVLANPRNDRGLALFATTNVLAVTALDVMCATQLSIQPETPARIGADRGILRAHRSITIGRPVEEVYGFWRDLENLPRFMRHLQSVRQLDERRSHWVSRAPGGKTVEWDAETTGDVANEMISWRSLPGSDVFNAGVVRFVPAPGGRGTEVHVELEYKPPFGKLGSKIAMLWREEPKQQLADSLRHFKQVMETGEILVSDATKQRGPHPAQPSDEPVRK